MKELPRIAEALYTGAWAILPEVHESMRVQFEAHLANGGDEVAGRKQGRVIVPNAGPEGKATDEVGPKWRDSETGETGFWHPQVTVRGTTAILPVKGIIGKHLSTLAMWCGGVDGALVAKQARNIAEDPAITHCVVWIDSPGGSCLGAAETAEAIEGIEEAGKFSIAYTDKQAASCGYFFASACQEIFAGRSAIVGSVSVYSAYLDISKKYEAEGKELLMFRTGNVKGMGYPGKAFTKEEKAFAQASVDRFGDQFKGFVRRRRPGVKEEDMQGQYWPAEFAPEGWVDGTANDIEEILAAIERKRARW